MKRERSDLCVGRRLTLEDFGKRQLDRSVGLPTWRERADKCQDRHIGMAAFPVRALVGNFPGSCALFFGEARNCFAIAMRATN